MSFLPQKKMTLFIKGYMLLPRRGSQHTIFEQWQTYPNTTGPETAAYTDTGMWMASQTAAIVVPAPTSGVERSWS